jgi:hypothetical protein
MAGAKGLEICPYEHISVFLVLCHSGNFVRQRFRLDFATRNIQLKIYGLLYSGPFHWPDFIFWPPKRVCMYGTYLFRSIPYPVPYPN